MPMPTKSPLPFRDSSDSADIFALQEAAGGKMAYYASNLCLENEIEAEALLSAFTTAEADPQEGEIVVDFEIIATGECCRLMEEAQSDHEALEQD
ncbi:unnamed protein product [Gemmata massiliana]|uniref:Uncharacterized protein n=1 Tax=Gemmata massiliana TaxID=1210884 RepID=A0A6P2DIF7_9BACT|nr:unnamed protein product [Gemmata massiliana]